MTNTVFVGTSLDGFIARPDGTFDFLPADGGEAHGFDELLASIDAIVMGRNTFETVLAFGSWPYGKTPVAVLTHRALDATKFPTAVVEAMSGPPAQIVKTLAARGIRDLYVDGGETVQGFLRAGLIDRLVVTRVPVLIGQGISLFGSLPHDVRLRHVSTRSFPSGLVQSEYAVLRETGTPKPRPK